MSTMEIINLNVIENDGFTKLDVDQPESTEMEMEQVEIIHAVSPTVDLERMTNGVKIKVNDYRGSSSEIVYDGPKGEPGEVTQAEFDELSESVDDLVKDVSNLNSAINDTTGTDLIRFSSGYINTSNDTCDVTAVVANASWTHAVVEVSAGEAYTVSGEASAGGVERLWAFVKDDGTVMERSESGTETELILTIPANCAYLVLNNKTTNSLRSYKGLMLKDVVSKNAAYAEEQLVLLQDVLTEGSPILRPIEIGDIIVGEYVKSTNGAIVQTRGYRRTDYIPITQGQYDKLRLLSSSPDGLNALVFCDAEKNFLSGITNPGTFDRLAINPSASYLMFSGVTNAMRDAELYGILDTKIEKIEEALGTKADVVDFAGTELLDYSVPLQDVYGITCKPGNLIVISECVNNRYINNGTGNEIASSSYFCTGFLPVSEGVSYRANVGRNYAWYDSEKNYIRGAAGTAIQRSVTAPENAAYIRFTINKSSDNMSDPRSLYFAELSEYDNSVVIPGLKTDHDVWCYGKTINWIGDSIVDGPDFDEYVCSALNLTKLTTDGVDGGINGSTIALNANGTNGRHALCLRYSNMPDDADIIAVSCGTNDFEYAWCPIGTIESTENTTFYGALKTLCEGLITKYPHSVIFFTTPIKRMQPFVDGDGGEYTADYVDTTPFSKNKYGKTLGDYADIIKEVCGLYSIPVLDMYRESLLNPHITAQQDCYTREQNTAYETSFYFYTHPNVTGQKIMARRVAGWLTQLGYTIS